MAKLRSVSYDIRFPRTSKFKNSFLLHALHGYGSIFRRFDIPKVQYSTKCLTAAGITNQHVKGQDAQMAVASVVCQLLAQATACLLYTSDAVDE